MALNNTQLGERIERGIVWLDEHSPDWPERIDLDDLDMGDKYCCIIAQLTEEPFNAGAKKLGLSHTHSRTWDDDFLEAERLGFSLRSREGGVSDARYRTLTKLWKDKITELRGYE